MLDAKKLLCLVGRHKWGLWRTTELRYTCNEGVILANDFEHLTVEDRARNCKRCGKLQDQRAIKW